MSELCLAACCSTIFELLAPAVLRLQDEFLLVDQASVLTQTPQALSAGAPQEEPLPAGLLSTRQLAQLAGCFKQAAPTGWVRLGDAADLMCRWVAVRRGAVQHQHAPVSSVTVRLRGRDRVERASPTGEGVSSAWRFPDGGRARVHRVGRLGQGHGGGVKLQPSRSPGGV